MKIHDKLWELATTEAAIVIAKRYGAQIYNVPSAYPYQFARESMRHYHQFLEHELIVQDKKDNAQTTHNKYQEIKEYAWKLYCHAYKNYEQENVLPISTCIEIATKFLAKFDKR